MGKISKDQIKSEINSKMNTILPAQAKNRTF